MVRKGEKSPTADGLRAHNPLLICKKRQVGSNGVKLDRRYEQRGQKQALSIHIHSRSAL